MKRMFKTMIFVLAWSAAGMWTAHAGPAADSCPALPRTDGTVDIAAQPSEYHGNEARTIKLYITYPDGTLDSVNAETGLLLSLHNWGGQHNSGAPVPSVKDYNVVVIHVDYLDTKVSSRAPPAPPYDHGYYQALDAIRALQYVYSELDALSVKFDHGRLYCTGGSGGGNVTLMANKLAPRTFACVVDVSGMASLTEDIAFNLKGGSGLRAGYSRDPESPNYLSVDGLLIRDPGCLEHLAVMKKLGCECMLVSIHGETDHACMFEDKKRVLRNVEAAGLNVEPHLITQADIDGDLIKDTGHGIGSRTRLFNHFAGKYVLPGSPDMRRNSGKNDFELRDELVVYPTPNGRFVISYKDGYPVGRFEPKQSN